MALKDLLIDVDQIEEKAIEGLVGVFVRYDPEKKIVIFLPDETVKLSTAQKIVIFLTALRGWRFLRKDSSSKLEIASPKDIALAIGENRSTVRNHIQQLSKKGLIYKTRNGRYKVASYAIPKIQSYLKKGTS